MATNQAISPPAVLLLPITGKVGNRYGLVIAHATVLDDDFTRTVLLTRRWNLKSGYPSSREGTGAARANKLRRVPLHQLVFRHYHSELPHGLDIDHIDRNPLNALPSNLRAVARTINARNTNLRITNKSGFRGVSFDGRNRYNKWHAHANINGRFITLGYFSDPISAAIAVNRIYQEHYPELDPPNSFESA